LLAGKTQTVEYGYLVRTRARLSMRSKDYGGALGHAEETIGIGTHHGERNLMALGLHDKGTILIGGDQCGEPRSCVLP